MFSFLSDQIGSRQVLIVFVLTGFVLCGIVEQSASVALRANSTSSYSAAEFAEYVENTSYITRYCHSENDTMENSNFTVHVVRSIPHIEVRICHCHTSCFFSLLSSLFALSLVFLLSFD